MRSRRIQKHVDRFWSSVDTDGACWEWLRGCGSHGYGQFYEKRGRPLLAHRYAWELAYGKIPPGMQVLHHCDNKRCVRAIHLFLGTPADNIRDMCAKGRHARTSTAGEASGMAKLTNAAVLDIRARFVSGTRQAPGNAYQLAREYAVTPQLIYRIVKRKSWAHLK